MKPALINEVTISPLLKSFINYLYSQEKIDNLSQENIRLAEEYDLPVMKQLSKLPEQQIKTLFDQGWQSFFNDIKNEEPIKGLYKGLEDWKEKKAGEEISSLDKTDITLGYRIRKQILVQQIENFSNNPLDYIDIVQELDNLLSKFELATLNYL